MSPISLSFASVWLFVERLIDNCWVVWCGAAVGQELRGQVATQEINNNWITAHCPLLLPVCSHSERKQVPKCKPNVELDWLAVVRMIACPQSTTHDYWLKLTVVLVRYEVWRAVTTLLFFQNALPRKLLAMSRSDPAAVPGRPWPGTAAPPVPHPEPRQQQQHQAQPHANTHAKDEVCWPPSSIFIFHNPQTTWNF